MSRNFNATSAPALRKQDARSAVRQVAQAQARRLLAKMFDLQQLERRQLLTTASVDASHILQIVGTSSADSITVNQLSSGQVAVTGVTTRFNEGSGAGQFNQIRIDAQGGSDTILISSNVDYNTSTILGGNGDDTITGGAGSDSLAAGDGNDRMDGGSGSGVADFFVGSTGFDTANYSSRSDSLKINLNNLADDGANNGAEGDNVTSSTEQVLTGSGNDTINGSSLDDFAGTGAGNDVLNGNGGNDSLTASTGADNVQAGDGDDFIEAMNNDRDTVNGGNGTDSASVDTIDVGSSPAFIGPKLKGSTAAAPAAVASSEHDLDPSFGTGGKMLSTLGWSRVTAMTVDSKGRLIFVGNQFGDGSDNDMKVARFTPGGVLDESFGTAGDQTLDFSSLVGGGYMSDDVAGGVTVDANDNIIVVGTTATDFGNFIFSDDDFAVARLNAADGTPDATFGVNGLTRFGSGSGYGSQNEEATDAVVERNGQIIVVGNTDQTNGFLVAQLNPADGSLHDGFGDGAGTAVVALPGFGAQATSVALQTLSIDEGGQRIVIGGANDNNDSNNDLAVVRLTPGGQLDNSFGTGYGYDFEDLGQVDQVNDIAVGANNQIVAVGITSTPIGRAAGVNAVLPEGAVVATWNSGGVFQSAISDSGNGLQEYESVAIDGQGSILAAGRAFNNQTNGYDFAVGRYDPATLAFDTDFSSTGPVTVDFTQPNPDSINQFDDAFGVFSLPDGKILAGGLHQNGDESDSPAAVRLLGRSIENNNTDVVENVENPGLTYQDIQGMSFPKLSADAVFYIKSQPNEHGQVALNLGDGDDVVRFFMTTDVNGKAIIAVDVNGIVLYYDPDTTKLFKVICNGGNDTVIGSDDITVPMMIDGGQGNDHLGGSGGDDTFLQGLTVLPAKPPRVTLVDGADVVSGGAGFDTMSYANRTVSIYVGLGDGANDGAQSEGDDVGADVEHVITGSGDDTIRGPLTDVNNVFDGGAGNDVEVGMGGDDVLNGGAGRDLLIGGNGADQLNGDDDDDLLIAGRTQYDLNDVGLKNLMKEWSASNRSYEDRLRHLRDGSGGYNGSFRLQVNNTVFNDTSHDQLTGGAGRDWFFANPTDDTITDLNVGGAESVDALVNARGGTSAGIDPTTPGSSVE